MTRLSQVLKKELIKNKTANKNEMLAGSYVVTVDDYENYSNPRLIDRTTFNNFAFKNGSFSQTAQLDFEQYGTEFKTPQYPLEFLSGLLNLNVYHEECVDMVSTYLTKYGFDISPPENFSGDVNIDLRDEILNWFSLMPTNILTTLSECGYDFEGIGVAGIEVLRENGLASPIQHYKRFDIVHSKLHVDGIRVLQEVNGKRRWFLLYGVNQEGGEQISVDRETGAIHPFGTLPVEREAHEVIWIRKYKTGTDNYGSSKISKAIDIIETEVGRSAFNRKFFKNYGLPAFVVTVTGNFTDAKKDKYLADGTLNPNFDETQTLEYIVGKQIEKMILEPYSAMVLTLPSNNALGGEVNVEITPLNNDVKEASFRLLREDNKKDICAAHGMSSDIIGTTQVGSLGGSTLETDINSFISDKIKPIQTLFCNAINPSIRERWETSELQFKLLNGRTEDKDKKLNRVLKLGNAGLLTRREQMVELGSSYGVNAGNPDEYLDEYLINGRTEEQIFELGLSAYNRSYSSNTNSGNIVDGSSIKSIEDDLLDEAYRLWCKDGKNANISLKSEAEKRLPANIQRIVRKHFGRRNKTDN